MQSTRHGLGCLRSERGRGRCEGDEQTCEHPLLAVGALESSRAGGQERQDLCQPLMEAHRHAGLPRAQQSQHRSAYPLTPALTSYRGLLLLKADQGCREQHLISSWLPLSMQWASSEEHGVLPARCALSGCMV